MFNNISTLRQQYKMAFTKLQSCSYTVPQVNTRIRIYCFQNEMLAHSSLNNIIIVCGQPFV